MLGFPSAIWFGGDSESYLHSAIRLRPGASRLSGYAAFLYLLRPFHSFAVVTAIQHAATPGGPAADAAAVPEPVTVASPATTAEAGAEPDSRVKTGSAQAGQRD